jgi:hypothetical protein
VKLQLERECEVTRPSDGSCSGLSAKFPEGSTEMIAAALSRVC